jgi:hypothetical protein
VYERRRRTLVYHNVRGTSSLGYFTQTLSFA